MACLRALLLVLAIGIAHGASAVESGGSGAAPAALRNDTAPIAATHDSEKPTTGSALPEFEVCRPPSFAASDRCTPCPLAASPRACHRCAPVPSSRGLCLRCPERLQYFTRAPIFI